MSYIGYANDFPVIRFHLYLQNCCSLYAAQRTRERFKGTSHRQDSPTLGFLERPGPVCADMDPMRIERVDCLFAQSDPRPTLAHFMTRGKDTRRKDTRGKDTRVVVWASIYFETRPLSFVSNLSKKLAMLTDRASTRSSKQKVERMLQSPSPQTCTMPPFPTVMPATVIGGFGYL
jgi:hypothetical protein